jgi:multisubunit Na+/H+ antiporter MnhE subunit
MLLAVGSDAVQVLAKAVTRSSTGRVETVDVGARGHGADATARRVGAIMAMSATPGTIVLDADDDGRITFHSLGCKGPRVEDKVARR